MACAILAKPLVSPVQEEQPSQHWQFCGALDIKLAWQGLCSLPDHGFFPYKQQHVPGKLPWFGMSLV